MTSSAAVRLSPDGADFDGSPLGRGDARRHLDGVVQILGLDEEKPAELLFGLGKWAVGRRELAVSDTYCGRSIGVLQAVAHDVVTALLDVFGKSPVVPLGLLDLIRRDIHFLLFFLVNQAQIFHGVLRSGEICLGTM